jgi:cyclic beta-1,2-glucan synthetase
MLLETEQKVEDNPFEATIKQIANSHSTVSTKGVGISIPLLDKFDYFMAVLKENHQVLSQSESKELTVSIAGEWFLDNYYIVQEVMQQIREAMPGSYYRKLPKLAETKYAGYARIYALAKEFIASTDNEFKAEMIEAFITQYQEYQVLTMGEIWAFPTMLRIVSLENFIWVASKLTGTALKTDHAFDVSFSKDLASEQAIANIITSLRAFAIKDWKAYYESVSRVEAILRQDPSQVYSKMDFETRNRYSNQIEDLAPYDGKDQENVARQAVALANQSQGNSRSQHVGYYLIDKGRETLEKTIGFSPSPRLRIVRWMEAHALGLYITSIMMIITLILLLIIRLLPSGSLPNLIFVLMTAILPASSIAIVLINWFITLRVPPRILPKMDFSKGIAPNNKTIVVIPALLSDKDEIASLAHQLEQHYLRNNDSQLLFALLLDFPDAPQKSMPNDDDLLNFAHEAITKLNTRHPEDEVFFLFVRERLWNESEESWMAWERKRGKLTEFNKLLLESTAKTSFIVQDGKLNLLTGTRYVITLDADTILPKATAARLVATMAHPLNQPVFNPNNRTVDDGYAILQPRVEIISGSTIPTIFTRIFSPDTALDLYSRAVSDVYQDQFAEGIYVGKGIYDVAAFEQSLEARVPENRLLSHDLFESLHARTALVSDIILLEDYPSNYFVYTGRLHRWTRGDWQLLPWLMPRVPTASGMRQNYFSALDNWKIFDNLRRSLIAPSLLISLVGSWFVLSDAALFFWSFFILLVVSIPFLMALASQILQIQSNSNWASIIQKLQFAFLRSLLALLFLPHEAFLSIHAIGLTLLRMVQKKKMLEWISSAHTSKLFGGESTIGLIVSQMSQSLIFVVLTGILLFITRPEAFLFASPFLLSWILVVPVAYILSQPSRAAEAPLSEKQIRKLRMLARRTWLFFEQYVGPEGHWLPPDHYQESPKGVIIHHTSPTNIGLLFLSTLAAYDFGYISILGLLTRLELAFEAMAKLERHRGHLLNWYDTRRLTPLQPHYVSTVDSGNLLGSLITLSYGLNEVYEQAMMHPKVWYGLLDILDIVMDAVKEIQQQYPDTDTQLLFSFLFDLEESVKNAAKESSPLHHLETVRNEKIPNVAQAVLDFLQMEQDTLDRTTVHNLRIYVDRLNQHVDNMHRDSNILLSWLKQLSNPPQSFVTSLPNPQAQASWERVTAILSTIPSLAEAVAIYELALSELDIIQTTIENADTNEEIAAWLKELSQNLLEAKSQVIEFQGKWLKIQEQIACYREEMDFTFLYHPDRKVFHIGYNLNSGKLDNSYYDLLASEARIASLIAIASNQVPLEHWLSLGRPLKQMNGLVSLVSWSGTMFEYLMPRLLMRDYPDTLMSQSTEAVVSQQMLYARNHKIPWGMSESGFYAFDNDMNYQYRAFGIPSLSFKRGMETEQVVSPYASFLALSIKPQDVLSNMDELNKHNGLGTYGYYEAIDFTKDRLPLHQSRAVVREYMAHHQGMLLIAVLNYLQADVMVKRFHADPYIESVEMLLREQMPDEVKAIPDDAVGANPNTSAKIFNINTSAWIPEIVSSAPRVHYLSNGSFGTLITSTGAGYSQWRDIALTRWRADTSLENWGTWIYLKEEDKVWSISFQPKPEGFHRVSFHPHQAEFHSHAYEIVALMSLTIAPEDDIEIRRIRLHNQTEQSRRISVSSYAEVVLAPQMSDQRHPAFNKLFVEVEYLPELNAVLCTRRARSARESPPYLLHLLFSGEELQNVRCETDRRQFLGRYRTASTPQVLSEEGAEFTGAAATSLDPVMALATDVDLASHEAVELAYLTIAGESRREVLQRARKYSSWSAIERVFMQGRYQSEQELYQLNLASSELEKLQKLLSALLYPQASLRSSSQSISMNTKPQSGLWAFGISGDYPILLLRLSDETQLPLLRDLLTAHIYWRQRNIKVTLVILNQRDSSYTEELYKQVHRLIVRMESEIWLNRHDGIFILRADLLSESDHTLLAASARVYLSGENGSLAEQLAAKQTNPIYLPDFVPSISAIEDVTPPLLKPENLAFDNGFGGFDLHSGEYIIYRPTPAPWLNVIANENFGFTISESGGGFSWGENSSENRLTAWRNDPVTDMPSEIVYLRDEETAQVWTTTPLPSGRDTQVFVRHGFGYSSFEQNSHGLKQKMTLFTVMDAPVKIIKVELENTWQRNRRITLTYYVEWILGTARDITQQYIVPEFDVNTQVLLAHNPYSIDFGNSYMFVSANQDFHDFTTDRQEFLGRLGNYAQPTGLRRIGLSDTIAAGIDSCAAIQLHMNLEVGQKDVVYFVLGGGVSRVDALSLAHRFRKLEQIDLAWAAMNAFWRKTLSSIEIQTPDAAMNNILPWLLYQALSCRIWGRSALYQSGGAYGFRDQLQDVMSLIHSHPQIAREHILRAARHQFEEGDVLHWWHPPSGRGVRTRFSDDLIWLPFVTAYYVETTGDIAILQAEEPFRKGPPLKEGEDERYNQYELTEQSYTVYEHCSRALGKGMTSGKHGLPLMGSGDWNDGMNRVGIEGRGESVWVAWFLCATLRSFIPLAERMQDNLQVETYRRYLQDLQNALENHAWDGEWYLRAFYDDGSPLGSSKSDECKIDAIAQSWAVISKSANPERARQAMESSLKYLYKPDEKLMLLFTPPFESTRKDPGYIKGYPLGVRENGGQYSHAALWTVWALAEMGDGEHALELFQMLNPINHSITSQDAERYRVEPYVIAADVYRTKPYIGMGGWTWYTGSSGWMYRLIVEAILGIQRHGDYLLIKPCIPESWNSYKLTYRFEEAVYQIDVQNSADNSVEEIIINGEAQSDLRIPLKTSGEYQVIIKISPRVK